jgi:hypothetical protein
MDVRRTKRARDRRTGRPRCDHTRLPPAWLPRSLSTTRHSTRGAAASGSASDGGRFREYLNALYENQPSERSDGLSDEELISLGLQCGLVDGMSVPASAQAITAAVMGELR